MGQQNSDPMNLVGAGTATGAYAALRQMIADKIAAEERARRAMVEDRSFGLQNRQLDLQDQMRRDQLAETTRQHSLADAEQQARTDATLNDNIPAGREIGAGSPVFGRLERIGALAPKPLQVDAPPAALAADPTAGAQELPGTVANAPSPISGRLYIKQASAKQADTIADNARADAALRAKAKQEGPSPYAMERETRNLQSVDELLGKVSNWTTGPGSMLASLPATDARNFKAELDTLKANIAFGELTAMREASKTGGALGQVSDKEGQLLQSALGALDTGQSPENFKAQLQKVKESITRWRAANGGSPARPVPSHDTTPQGGGDHPPMVKNGWNYEWKGDRYTAVSPVGRPNSAPSVAPQAGVSSSAQTPLDSNRLPELGALAPAQGDSSTMPLDTNRLPDAGSLAPPAPRRLGNQVSPQGLENLQTREGGFYGTPYQDSGTGLAVGYGMHQWQGKNVTPDLRVTEPQANTEMDRQIKTFYGRVVDDALRVPVSQAQYDALVSMAWNLPAAALRVIDKLNRGEPITDADFRASATVGGKPHRGLAQRRDAEFSSFKGTP